ncbi:MAG: hypothetical protein H6791_01345 [Candidatus Nomurabacteria bacterium]|nr:MAG: hypothetical protein H6791_01345 [Candidatus Nomurabacteria bacterium]
MTIEIKNDLSNQSSNKVVIKKANYTNKELNEKFSNLEYEYNNLERRYNNFENRMDGYSNKMLNLTTGIAIALTAIAVFIVVDYAYNRGDGYKRYIDKVNEVSNTYYSKEEIDSTLKKFKECIHEYGSYFCTK